MSKVSIYTTPACVYCKMAKEFFTKNNIQYTEYNVVTDVPRRDEMIQRSGQMGVPVIDIDGSIIVGFNEMRMKQLLGISK